MSDSTSAEAMQQIRENFQRHMDAEYEMWVTVSKSTAVLNSAAVVAMLGFLQALMSKPEAIKAFKLFGVAALMLYLLGALLSVLTLIARRKYLFAMSRDIADEASTAHDRGANFISAALTCFFIGSVCVLIGVSRAL